MKFFCISVFIIQIITSYCTKTSLLSPPWKHCVHQLHSLNKWQEFSSPGFPYGITTQTQCSWIISANPPQRIKLAFHTLNLTGSVNSCFTQFIQIWEIKSGKSQGKFCGDRRPGDYVSYGSVIRIDLKADTAASGHEGFLMKYKATRETGGFKSTFSFVRAKPKKPNGSKPPKTKTTLKPSVSSSNNNNGGKVNLNLRQKQRERAVRRPSPSPGTATKKSPNQLIRLPPQRNTQHNIPPRREMPSRQNNIKVTINEDSDSDPPVNLPIIIGIPVAGLIILIVIIIVIKLCFCKKKEKNKKTQDVATKTPLSANSHPIQRRHQIPGGVTDHQPQPHIPQEPFPTRKPLDTQPQRAKRNHDATMASLEQPASRYVMQTDAITSDVINNGLKQGTITPVEGGYLFYYPGSEGDPPLAHDIMPPSISHQVSLGDDDGYGTGKQLRTKSEVGKKKKVPTLKRKFSQWEKEQIKKGTLKN